MSAWSNLFVPPSVLRALSEQGFTDPTAIQVLSLPSAIRDRMDIVGAAQTGSGKTLAFAIPLLHGILRLKEQQQREASSEVEVDDEDLSGDSEEDSAEPEEDSGGEFDLPPDGEDEENELFGEDQIGCIRTVHNVAFDWLEESSPKAKDKSVDKPLYALILTPTRELAIQVRNHITAAAKYTGIHCVAVVGGMSAQKQERLLRKGPEIVVATPGRLWELYSEMTPHLIKMPDIRFLVIDEADRMVEKGHFEELEKILGTINSNEENEDKRQTFVFSATLTFTHQTPQRLFLKKKSKQRIVHMTKDKKLHALMCQIGMRDKPKVIDLTEKHGTADTLTEARVNCGVHEKDLYLYYFLKQYPQRTLVFCNSKDCIRRLISVFQLLRCCPLPLHADMQQRQRLKNLDRFKGNPQGLLLATDVAARGLDIPGVEHVIHYQVPRTTENYVHRSGRTARASKEGLSVMLVSPEDLRDYRKIIKSLNRDEDLPLFPIEMDFVTTLKPRVDLARSIDSQEHKIGKMKKENSWFQKAAKEMDIELDEDLLNDTGDSWEQARNREKLVSLKAELQSLLQAPVVKRQRSGKYLTHLGKFSSPFMSDKTVSDALDRIKKDCKPEEEETGKSRNFMRNLCMMKTKK